MALKGKSNTAAASEYKKADAFLNMVVVDSNGNRFKLKKGAAQYFDDSTIKAMAAAPQGTVFHIEATLQLAVSPENEEIPIFA